MGYYASEIGYSDENIKLGYRIDREIRNKIQEAKQSMAYYVKDNLLKTGLENAMSPKDIILAVRNSSRFDDFQLEYADKLFAYFHENEVCHDSKYNFYLKG